jgi:hypothetical protein
VSPLGERSPQFLIRDVRRLTDQPQDQVGLRFHTARAAIAAERPWPGVALCSLQIAPAAHAGGTDPEPRRHGSVAGSLGDSGKNSGPEIE